MSGHRVNRIEVELRSTDAEQGRSLLERVSRMRERGLSSLLDRVFTLESSADHVDRIERLELDLGSVSFENFEDDFLRELEASATKALREGLSDGPIEAGSASLELLELFGCTGNLPWWASTSRGRVDGDPVRVHFEHALSQDRSRLRALLEGFAEDKVALGRLARASDNQLLGALVDCFRSEAGELVRGGLSHALGELRAGKSASSARTRGNDTQSPLDGPSALAVGARMAVLGALCPPVGRDAKQHAQRMMREFVEAYHLAEAFADLPRQTRSDEPPAPARRTSIGKSSSTVAEGSRRRRVKEDVAQSDLERAQGATESSASAKGLTAGRRLDPHFKAELRPSASVEGAEGAQRDPESSHLAPAAEDTGHERALVPNDVVLNDVVLNDVVLNDGLSNDVVLNDVVLNDGPQSAVPQDAAHQDPPKDLQKEPSQTPSTRHEQAPNDVGLLGEQRKRPLKTFDRQQPSSARHTPPPGREAQRQRPSLDAALPEARSLQPALARRLSERRRRALECMEEVYTGAAGLVILWPFLQRLFARCGLLSEEREFVDEAAQSRAVALASSLVTLEPQPREFELALAKLLCGLNIDAPLQLEEPLSAEHMQEGEQLLAAAISHAGVLKEMKPATFRSMFLAREGALSVRDGCWLLRVERRAEDVILDRFPWTWQWMVQPWMSSPLKVEW